MEFRRVFPGTVWLWNKRTAIAWTSIAIVSIPVGLYKSLEFAYIYQANKVLAVISSVHSEADANAAILKLDGGCRVTRTESSDDDVLVIRTCSEGDFLHPYLRIQVADSLNRVTGRRTLSAYVLVPRGYAPVNLRAERLVSGSGKALKIERRPSAEMPRGIAVYAQAHSDFTVRVNYKCAIPFARCVGEKELISITTD
jgi:hypothetical protein